MDANGCDGKRDSELRARERRAPGFGRGRLTAAFAAACAVFAGGNSALGQVCSNPPFTAACDPNLRHGNASRIGPGITCVGENLADSIEWEWSDVNYGDTWKATGATLRVNNALQPGNQPILQLIGNAVCTDNGGVCNPASGSNCAFPCLIGVNGKVCSDGGLTLPGLVHPNPLVRGGVIVIGANYIVQLGDAGLEARFDLDTVSLNDFDCSSGPTTQRVTLITNIAVPTCDDGDPCTIDCCEAGVCTERSGCDGATCRDDTGVIRTFPPILCNDNDVCTGPDTCDPTRPTSTPQQCCSYPPIPFPNLTLCKEDTSGASMPGVELCVTGPEPGCCTTGADGCCSLNDLTPGSYSISEPTPPPGYEFEGCTPANPIELRCTDPRMTVTATCENRLLVCGDNVVNRGEETCDDEDERTGVDCTQPCRAPTDPVGIQCTCCGDDLINGPTPPTAGGEYCDGAAQRAGVSCNASGCRGDCTCCGDGVVQQAHGERCEPPGTATCDNNCGPIFGAVGCRITGGRTVLDGIIVADPDGVEIVRGQGGGQVGAPCGCIGCFDGFDHVQGQWQYSRKRNQGNFHARDFNSLICGCDQNGDCNFSGVSGSAFANPAAFSGDLCNAGDRGPGPEPRPSPANVACFSGIGGWTSSNGRREVQVAFRVEVEDRGEPSAAPHADETCDVYQIRIWIPNESAGETAESLAAAVCCVDGYDTIRSDVRAPDIRDGGNLVHGNIQIHPQTPNSQDGRCPVPDGSCQQP